MYWCNFKKLFLLNSESIFLLFLFFQLFGAENIEKAYFDQRLECAASKGWSKYTAPLFAQFFLFFLLFGKIDVKTKKKQANGVGSTPWLVKIHSNL